MFVKASSHPMNASELLIFSVRGFSPNRMAYLLNGVALALWLLYSRADSLGSSYVGSVAFAITIVVLLLCLFTPRTVRQRWLPFLIGFIIFVVGGIWDHI